MEIPIPLSESESLLQHDMMSVSIQPVLQLAIPSSESVILHVPANLIPVQLVQPDDLRQLRAHRRLHDRHRLGEQHRDQVRRQDGGEEGRQQGAHHRLRRWSENQACKLKGCIGSASLPLFVAQLSEVIWLCVRSKQEVRLIQ